jgi:Domain of unknown function (DUF4112)
LFYPDAYRTLILEPKGFIPFIGNFLGVREMIRALKLLKDDFQIPEKLYRRMLLRLAVPTAASCLPILGSFIVAVCVFSPVAHEARKSLRPLLFDFNRHTNRGPAMEKVFASSSPKE